MRHYVAVALGPGREPGEVGAGVGLGEQLAPHLFAADDPREEARLLLVGAVPQEHRADQHRVPPRAGTGRADRSGRAPRRPPGRSQGRRPCRRTRGATSRRPDPSPRAHGRTPGTRRRCRSRHRAPTGRCAPVVDRAGSRARTGGGRAARRAPSRSRAPRSRHSGQELALDVAGDQRVLGLEATRTAPSRAARRRRAPSASCQPA